MSDDENPKKKAKVAKSKSDGGYKVVLWAQPTSYRPHETPAERQLHRGHWLVNQGASGDGQLMKGAKQLTNIIRGKQCCIGHKRGTLGSFLTVD